MLYVGFCRCHNKKKAIANTPANQALLCESKVSLDVKERLVNQRKRSQSKSATGRRQSADVVRRFFQGNTTEQQHNVAVNNSNAPVGDQSHSGCRKIFHNYHIILVFYLFNSYFTTKITEIHNVFSQLYADTATSQSLRLSFRKTDRVAPQTHTWKNYRVYDRGSGAKLATSSLAKISHGRCTLSR